ITRYIKQVLTSIGMHGSMLRCYTKVYNGQRGHQTRSSWIHIAAYRPDTCITLTACCSRPDLTHEKDRLRIGTEVIRGITCGKPSIQPLNLPTGRSRTSRFGICVTPRYCSSMRKPAMSWVKIRKRERM